jgi:hypothetical protein
VAALEHSAPLAQQQRGRVMIRLQNANTHSVGADVTGCTASVRLFCADITSYQSRRCCL